MNSPVIEKFSTITCRECGHSENEEMPTDGVWYLLADGEYFYYIGDDKPPERFASKRRIRLGLGYRHSYEWRFEVLAMRDEAKETLKDEIDVDTYILNLRIKWFL